MRAIALALSLVAFQDPVERPAAPRGAVPPCPSEPLGKSSGGKGLSAEQVSCGALFREGFRTPYLHPEMWRSFQADPGVTYEIKNGAFRVFGLEGKEPNANRAFSRDIHSDDAVLVCGMRANNLVPGQGRTMYRIHYCGRVPDRYAEVALENYDGAIKWRFWANRVGGELKDAPTVVATIPAEGIDLKQFHELMIVRDGPASAYRGFVHFGGKWRQIGEPVRTVGPFLKVELKWWVEEGHRVDVEFAQCRV